MTSGSDRLVPAPMEDHGAYNRNSHVQAAGLLPAVALFERAASEVSVPAQPQAIVIADYGSSAGRNSLLPMKRAIDVLRPRLDPQRAISVVHTDLPENDFSGLFATLRDDPESYQTQDHRVFASAVGRSFYDQILPESSVTLGWSSWAVQWLSRVPGPVPDHVQVACSRHGATRALFADQAARDWKRFLTCRSHELLVGGQLVVLTMALDETGSFGYGPLLEALYATLVTLADEDVITADELSQMVIPTVGRTEADLRAPFQDGTFEGLSLTQLDVFYGEDHIWHHYEHTRDADAFGRAWAAFPRSSVFPTLANSLKRGRDDPRAAIVYDRLEKGIATRLAETPARMLIPLSKMTLVKAAPSGEPIGG